MISLFFSCIMLAYESSSKTNLPQLLLSRLLITLSILKTVITLQLLIK